MKKKQFSIAEAPSLRAVHNPYSVRYYVFVDGKIKELLATFSKQRDFNLINIKYTRLKYWLNKGLKVDKLLVYSVNKLFSS